MRERNQISRQEKPKEGRRGEGRGAEVREEKRKQILEVKIKLICHAILIPRNSSFRIIVSGPGNLLEIHTFRLHPRPTESETFAGVGHGGVLCFHTTFK